ncbi:ankyrin repeat domain-containing protein [Planococcus halocryophilus]|uniref:Ankryin n=1 Tax=Planococcus halocryophilus TaxID=1215089 RepID=A0A1C7DTI3_9BACL|nr:ankyrin repeat domain-containing protein [Planococcus halocryophilus]ANU14581.1 hypothetical protein BBI08_12150 [Planococcus halocryophilus]
MTIDFNDKSLLSASASGDLEQVRMLLDKKVSIQYKDEFGQTALMQSVLSNHFAITEFLLKEGSNPNHKDSTGLSPFIAAGANGFSASLKLMTRYSADVNSVNRFGGTALLPSSEKGYVKTVQYCLEAGVPVNHINKLGWTALHEAVVLGDGGHLYALVIRLLLEAGADFQIKDRQGLSSHDHAQMRDQTRIIELFKNGASDDTPLENKLFFLYKKEAYDEALNVIENALSAGENLNKLSFWKGLILQEIKEFNRAIAAYSKGIRDDKQFYFYIANCYRLMGKAEEALQTFDKATKENPETSFFQYHKSNYLREIGRHLEAIVVMDQLLENSSNRTDYLFHKANSLRALEKHNEAIQAMNIAIHYDASSDLFKEHKNLSIKLIKVSKKN